MQRYDSYKDSGIQWLGEIPSHWEVQKMKWLFTERSEKGHPNEPLLAATQNHGVILKDQYENRTVEATKSLDSLKLVKPEDFVISLRSFQGGIEMSYAQGIISPAYTILIPQGITSGYFKHLGKSPIFIALLKSMVTGIREGQNIDYGKLKEEFMPLPSIEEQQAIASYLDTATAKIDEAIAQQQKMIDLLNERKQIIINNAVTKGLNPNAKMKDSGVEWLGKIPAHWEIKKSFHCVNIGNGCDPKSDGDTPVYGSGSTSFRTCGEYKEGPCVLIGRKGATLHIPHYIEGRYWNVDTAFDVKSKGEITLKFYYYLATCFDYKFYISQTTLPSMTLFDYNRIKIPIPPPKEQLQILDWLDNQIEHINETTKGVLKQIALLQERKQIIINDVVTGKVKVI